MPIYRRVNQHSAQSALEPGLIRYTARAAIVLFFGCIFFTTTVVQAESVSGDKSSMATEIDFLIQSVANSQCTFVRNGKEHSGADARDHLQLKRKNGKRYYKDTEQFIDRIASKSSWTGKDYLIKCPGKDTVTAREWFTRVLAEFRATSAAD